MKNFIGIDFGDSYITIYKQNEGIVLKQPSLVSVLKKGEKYTVCGYGDKSKQLQLENDENIITFSPIQNGLVKSVEYAGLLIKNLLKQINNKGFNIYILTPFAINYTEKFKYEQVCKFAGIKHITQITSIDLIAKNLDKFEGIICDIGGGVTDCAFVKNQTVYKGATLSLGGNNLNISLIRLFEAKNLLISNQTAENLKIKLSSLFSSDLKKLDIMALDLETSETEKITVYSKDILSCVKAFFDEIFLLIKATISENIELIGDKKLEVVLVGGTSLITGVSTYLQKRLNCSVKILEEADNFVPLCFKSLNNI